MLKIICVCGARPNFMKIAPLIEAFNKTGNINSHLVHTGQHYDHNMSKLFFDDLGIPRPDVNLEVGSGSQSEQTANIMLTFEPILLEHKPDWVIVVGDVTSTIACGLVAVKNGVRLAHVEAGLRSFDRRMPEEINRVLTDSISDLLLVSEPSGVDNLRKEGVDDAKVHLVGNVMIDTLLKNRQRADESTILDDLGLQPQSYALVTLHRPSNVDNPEMFSSLLDGIEHVQQELTVVFPAHPRTRARLESFGLQARMDAMPNVKIIEPQGYLAFLKLMSAAAIVMSDSGGIQEETTILGVPCLTLRENTERPITITEGTNRLVTPSGPAMIDAYKAVRQQGPVGEKRPQLWDGHAAERIAKVLIETSAGS